jgi:hypothetical protein
MARPTGLAPPVPGGGNRARSNSDQSGRDSTAGASVDTPPQLLGGLFAGGIPKLKKRGGGVDTGGPSLGYLIKRMDLTKLQQIQIHPIRRTQSHLAAQYPNRLPCQRPVHLQAQLPPYRTQQPDQLLLTLQGLQHSFRQ